MLITTLKFHKLGSLISSPLIKVSLSQYKNTNSKNSFRMKYEVEVEINLPRDKVIELFDNPENMKYWQPGLVSFEPISGSPGQVGAKSKLQYKIGKRELEMVETITVNDLPLEFSGTYEAKGVWNHVQNFFIEKGNDKTIWKSVNEFKCSGFLRIMIFLMPDMFKKETSKYLANFKEFAESK